MNKNADKQLVVWIFSSILFFSMAGCEKKADQSAASHGLGKVDKENSVILKVQDSFYKNSDFERELLVFIGEDYRSLSAESLSRLLDNFIEEKILLKAAQEKNITLTREEQKEYLAKLSNESWTSTKDEALDETASKMLFENLLIEKYIYEHVKGLEVSDEEIKAYYTLHKREFLRPERVKVSQILMKSEEKAVEILERLNDSTEEEFRAAARQTSIGVEASSGGEMGLFEMGQLPFEMEKVVFALKEGELSPVVESAYGYHIFRLDAKYEPELVSEDEASPEIRIKILDQKINQSVSQHTEELKARMDWNFVAGNLSFPYQKVSNE